MKTRTLTLMAAHAPRIAFARAIHATANVFHSVAVLASMHIAARDEHGNRSLGAAQLVEQTGRQVRRSEALVRRTTGRLRIALREQQPWSEGRRE